MVVVRVDIISNSPVRAPGPRAVGPLRLVGGRRERLFYERRRAEALFLRRLRVGPRFLHLLLLGPGLLIHSERSDVGRGHLVAGLLVGPGDLVGPAAIQYIVDDAGVPAVAPECGYVGACTEGFSHFRHVGSLRLLLRRVIS